MKGSGRCYRRCSSRAGASACLWLVLAASLTLQPAECVDLMFVGSSSFLVANPPSTLSAVALSNVIASLLSCPAPFPVDKAMSSQINQVISSDFVQRPTAVWAVSVAGLSSQDAEVFGKLKAWNTAGEFVHAGPVVLEEGQPLAVVSAVAASVEVVGKARKTASLPSAAISDCMDACLEQTLVEMSTALGFSYEPVLGALDGTLGWASIEGSSLSLKDSAVKFWVKELIQIWKEVQLMALSEEDTAALLDTKLLGLQLIKEVHSSDSKEFRLAAKWTWNMMGGIHEMLSARTEGGIVTQIAFLGDVTTVGKSKELDVLVDVRRRQMLQAESRTAKKSTFNTNASAYGIMLFIFFFLLGGLFVMTNMDFSSDTLLYSQSKVD